jgi:hypothetical protein
MEKDCIVLEQWEDISKCTAHRPQQSLVGLIHSATCPLGLPAWIPSLFLYHLLTFLQWLPGIASLNLLLAFKDLLLGSHVLGWLVMTW